MGWIWVSDEKEKASINGELDKLNNESRKEDGR